MGGQRGGCRLAKTPCPQEANIPGKLTFRKQTQLSTPEILSPNPWRSQIPRAVPPVSAETPPPVPWTFKRLGPSVACTATNLLQGSPARVPTYPLQSDGENHGNFTFASGTASPRGMQQQVFSAAGSFSNYSTPFPPRLPYLLYF